MTRIQTKAAAAAIPSRMPYPDRQVPISFSTRPSLKSSITAVTAAASDISIKSAAISLYISIHMIQDFMHTPTPPLRFAFTSV